MKILVISNLYPPDVIGGYEVTCEQMTDALRARGHEALVLTSAPRTPARRVEHVRRTLRLTDIWNQHAVGPQPAVVKIAMDATSRLVDAFNVQQLTTAIEVFRPDVVYVSNLTGLGGLGLMCALRHLGVPWVWQLGDSVPAYICGLRGSVVPALASAFARDFRGTYVSVSSRLVREIGDLGVTLNGRVEVLPCWIQGEMPPSRTNPYLAGGRLRLVSAGRLTPYKGIDRLIEAIGLLKAAGDDRVSLDLYGDAADVDDAHYPSMIVSLGLEDRVRLRGKLSHGDMLAAFSRYDVFAMPTWEREPFGLGPLEAAAHGGCAPLISARCGLAEWLVHGVHCLKTEPDAESLAAVFRRILDGSTPIEPIARRAAEVAWRDFHLDVVATKFEAILRDAAQAERPPRIGDAAEAERLAILAEKLVHAMIARHAA